MGGGRSVKESDQDVIKSTKKENICQCDEASWVKTWPAGRRIIT